MSRSITVDVSHLLPDATMSDYKPIPCINYEQFELAIMHHETLRITWSEGNVFYERVIRPTDLQTKSGEEFLLFRDTDGHDGRVRLDHIHKVTPA